MSNRIFISYRRDDTKAYAGRLHDHLSNHFGPGQIFMDIQAIEPGVDFVEVIEQAVGSCDVLIALIGPQWSMISDGEGQRRLDDPHDFVRLEITTALERGIPVFPVLVDGAAMPAAKGLPDPLTKLARFNATELSDSRWRYDVERLIEALERRLRERSSQFEPTSRSTIKAVVGVGSVALLLAIVGIIIYFAFRDSDGGLFKPEIDGATVRTTASSDRPTATLPSIPTPVNTPAVVYPTDVSRFVELAQQRLGSISDIAVRPDGQVLAVIVGLNVELYDAESLQHLAVLNEGARVLTALAWSPDGRQLALGAQDGTVRVWDAATGKGLLVLRSHQGQVNAVAWSLNGRRLASGGNDSKVRIWDVDTGQELHSLVAHAGDVLGLAWSPDGQQLASAGGDSLVRVWDAATGEELAVLVGHQDVVRLVTWSPDGARLASGASADGQVRIWDVDDARQLDELEGSDVAWSPNGGLLAVGDGLGPIHIWALNSQGAERELVRLEGHQDLVWYLAWLRRSSGPRLISGSFDDTIRVWGIEE